MNALDVVAGAIAVGVLGWVGLVVVMIVRTVSRSPQGGRDGDN